MNTQKQTIRGYELQERIGAGGFGVVYRAYQPAVERQVAIKVILPQYASQVEFIRRFEAEAQLVARLEHLHIVPLYDYWREPDGAYLVMRWLRGGSLDQSIAQDGPWDPEAAARLLDQIASALMTAHRRHIIHRDVKPENILLDEERNAYLSDFGIATDLIRATQEEPQAVVTGSPAYIAPEQARGQAAGPQSDLYSLGVVLYEVLTGQHPFPAPTPIEQMLKHLSAPLPPLLSQRPDLPPGLEEVLRRATAKDPAERYPDVLAFAAAFRQAIRERAAEPAWGLSALAELAEQAGWGPVNPYKGLRPFEEADAADFFGRQALVERLLARLEVGASPPSSRFLALVGPSGSGKSSVVKAGLLPALRRQAPDWFVIEMTPGEHPLAELEMGLLRIAAAQPPGLAERLRHDEQGLLWAAETVLPTAKGDLLLIVDQFEEIFGLADEAEAEQLLRLIVAAVTAPQSRVRVLITLRADFYDRPLMHPAFGPLMRRRTEVVVPITTEELTQAVTGPAEQVGVEFEPGLAAAIVAEVREQPGALPMLQYALTELFERRDGRRLTWAAYREIGGVSGALARRAEEVYAALDEAGQQAARQLFLRLVTLGEGSEDTRRRARLSELRAVGVDRAAMDGVIETFGRSRLLLFDRDPATREPTVEVAHEALLRQWDRLRTWLNESRADVRMERLLAAAAQEWHEANGDPSFLLRGARLAQFEEWAAATRLALTEKENDFLQASIADREARQAEEEARRRRELETARQLAETERRRAEEQAQAALRLRRRAFLLGGLLVVALLLALAAFFARQQAVRNERRAEEQRRIAVARELAAAALANLDADPERSVLLAMEAVSTTYAVDGSVTRQAEEALHRVIPASRILLTLRGHSGPVRFVAFSPDGSLLATSSSDGTARLWDTASGQEIATLTGHGGDVTGLDFSPDGAWLATTGYDGAVRLWDVAGGRELALLGRHPGGATGLAFSPDGRWVATSGLQDGTVYLWDAIEGGAVYSFTAHYAPAWYVAFSPDGQRLATASVDGTAKVWDSSGGGELLTLAGHEGLVSVVAFSPDGTRLATSSFDTTVRLWDAASGQSLLTLTGHTSMVSWVAFSPDGRQLATASVDGTARVWDAASGRQLLTLPGHVGVVIGVAFSPDGTRLASGGFDGTARIWDLAPDHELRTLIGHGAEVYALAFSSDGTRLVTTGFDGAACLWDVASGQLLRTFANEGGLPMRTVAFSPDGTRLVIGNADGTATVWDGGSGQALLTLRGHTLATGGEGFIGGVTGVAYSPDGRRIATAGDDGTAKVWDAAGGEELLTLRGHRPSGIGLPPYEGVVRVVYSPDGARLATAGADGTARLWDAGSGEELLTLESGSGSVVVDVAFSPDGRQLATGEFDGTARVWDLDGGQNVLTLTGHTGSVSGIAFDSTGARLATASRDGTARLWDAVGGEELLTLYGHTLGLLDLAFSPDDRLLATASEDRTVRLYLLPIEELLTLAQGRVTRSLTPEEYRQFLHREP